MRLAHSRHYSLRRADENQAPLPVVVARARRGVHQCDDTVAPPTRHVGRHGSGRGAGDTTAYVPLTTPTRLLDTRDLGAPSPPAQR